MVTPVLLTVDDDRDVLNAVARDLRSHYGQVHLTTTRGQDWRSRGVSISPQDMDHSATLVKRRNPSIIWPGMDQSASTVLVSTE